MSADRWLRRVGAPQPDSAGGVLLAYPHAGAGAPAYLGWPARFAGAFDVYACQPPGRHDRFHEPMASSITEIASRLAEQIARLPTRRVVLLGHSMGALVMYETAVAMRAAGSDTPVALIASGHPSPLAMADAEPDRPRTDEDLLALCRRLGADEVEEMCVDVEHRALVLGPLRHDLALLDAYRLPAEREPLDVPILLLRGSRDEATPAGIVDDWSMLTTGEVSARVYDGGHFFIRADRDQVTGDVEAYLAANTRHGTEKAIMDHTTHVRTPPRQKIDAAMAASVFATVLGRPTYPVDASLLAAGGTSLHAVRIAQHLSALAGLTVPAMSVLLNPSPTALARALAEEVPTATATAPARTAIRTPARAGRWPLASPQRRIWALHERVPDRLDHLVTVSLTLDGAVPSPQALSQAWSEVMRRHPALRMRVDDATDLDAVVDGADAGLQFLDASALPEFLSADIIEEELNRIRCTPFNLRTGPVARALLIRRADSTMTLDLVIHHIAADLWSLRILLDELFTTALTGASVEETSRLSYGDFARWEQDRSACWERLLERAATDLLPAPDPLLLPTRRDSGSTEAVEVSLDRDDAWADRLRAAFTRHAYSPLVIGLVALSVTLNHTFGQESFYIAVPVANRPPEFDTVVGNFVNTSMVRIDLHGVTDLIDVLESTRTQVARVYDSQDLPYEQLTARLRKEAGGTGAALADVALTIQNVERHQSEYGGGRLKVSWTEIAERESKYPLVVTMDTIEMTGALSLTCSPDRFTTASATALLGRLERAMELVLTQIEER